jgi:DnaJ-class molecular chaperone
VIFIPHHLYNHIEVAQMIKDYYDVLSLRKDASANEINQQYKRLVLRWHPRFAK